MAFERFDKATAVVATKAPSVNVAVSGVISLTWRAYEMLGKPMTVEFFFDPAEGVIGMAPCRDDDPNGYSVRQPRGAADDGSEARGMVSVRGTSLFKYYDVKIDKKFRETPYMDGNLLCFRLPKRPSPQPPQARAEFPSPTPIEEPPF